MSDLADFLRARADEDEAVAKAALPGPWMTGESAAHLVNEVIYGQSRDWPGHIVQVANVEYGSLDKIADAAHIARHDPSRVLREVAATRAILRLHHAEQWNIDGHPDEVHCAECTTDDDLYKAQMWPCATVRALASVHSGHPEFDPSWATS